MWSRMLNAGTSNCTTPVPQPHDAVEELACEIDRVDAGDERLPQLLGHVGEQAHHFPRAGGVERCHRLVRENDTGVLDEEPGYGDPLLLASREPSGALVREVHDANPFERVERQALLLGPHEGEQRPAETPIAEPSRQHVVQHRQVRDEVELLGDHTDEPRELATRPETRDVPSPQFDDSPLKGRLLPL